MTYKKQVLLEGILVVMSLVMLGAADLAMFSGLEDTSSSGQPASLEQVNIEKTNVPEVRDILGHVEQALELLEIDSEDAGVTLQVGVLKFFIDSEGNKVTVRIERITKFRRTQTQVDTTELLEVLTFDSIEDAKEKLPTFLEVDSWHGGRYKLFYRKSEFARGEFTSDRSEMERFSGINKSLGSADKQLLEFVDKVTAEALAWGEGKSRAGRISLWFYPGSGLEAVYTTITIGDNCFQIELADRVSYPWHKSVETVYSQTEVAEVIGSFLSKRHAFEFDYLRVYFAHTPVF